MGITSHKGQVSMPPIAAVRCTNDDGLSKVSESFVRTIAGSAGGEARLRTQRRIAYRTSNRSIVAEQTERSAGSQLG